MKYLFKSIIGNFIFDDHLQIIDEGKQKYPKVVDLPEKKMGKALLALKDKKYYAKFYEANLKKTKQDIKASVTDGSLIIQAIANINELDRTCNLLTKRLREWHGLYFPELRVEDNEKRTPIKYISHILPVAFFGLTKFSNTIFRSYISWRLLNLSFFLS